tara:strand:- start:12993 stop:13625 length:633 start_codon:yes stop_codon:yes gene_type:complete
MIVAEIGQNFQGDSRLAKKLIRLAKENGADKVKFQLYDSKKLYGEYQDTEVSKEQALEFSRYGDATGIEVFFSVFDTERIKWCEDIGVKRYKVAFSKQHDTDILDALRSTGKPIIMSCDIPVRDNYQRLYCVPEYPAREVELTDMDKFGGFSDHTIGLDASKIALAAGAGIIEKHFAIDHTTGVDAEWSMTPSELKELRRFSESLPAPRH